MNKLNKLTAQMDYEDDVDVREQMFHNAVREYIVSRPGFYCTSNCVLSSIVSDVFCLFQRHQRIDLSN